MTGGRRRGASSTWRTPASTAADRGATRQAVGRRLFTDARSQRKALRLPRPGSSAEPPAGITSAELDALARRASSSSRTVLSHTNSARRRRRARERDPLPLPRDRRAGRLGVVLADRSIVLIMTASLAIRRRRERRARGPRRRRRPPTPPRASAASRLRPPARRRGTPPRRAAPRRKTSDGAPGPPRTPAAREPRGDRPERAKACRQKPAREGVRGDAPYGRRPAGRDAADALAAAASRRR